jgi:hypothetical protein
MNKRNVLLTIIIILIILIVFSLLFIDYSQGPKQYISKEKINNYTTKFIISQDQNLIVSFDENLYYNQINYFKDITINGKSIGDYNLSSDLNYSEKFLLVNYLLDEKFTENGLYYNQFFKCENALTNTDYVYSDNNVCFVYFGRDKEYIFLDIDFNRSLYPNFKDKKIKINDADLLFLKINVKNFLSDSPKLYDAFKKFVSPYTKYIPKVYIKVNDYEVIDS